MVNLGKYAKTIAAVIGAIITVGGVVLSQHYVSGQAAHWVTVAVSVAATLGTMLGVYSVPNSQPSGPAPDSPAHMLHPLDDATQLAQALYRVEAAGLRGAQALNEARNVARTWTAPYGYATGGIISPTAQGIHAHPHYKTGLKPHGKSDDQLLGIGWKDDTVPAYEAQVDRLSSITIGLNGNDQYGNCEEVADDNHRRVASRFLNGTELDATLGQVLTLYSQSTSPPFNPATGANDDGTDMVSGMKALMKDGLGGDKIVAYAKLKDTSDESIYAAIDLFGAVIFAVDLQVAQQTQTDQPNPVWDYKRSADWGGHAIVAAGYDSTTGIIEVGSWGMKVGTTKAFRAHQLQEVWVPIWPWLTASKRFVQNVDAATLVADFSSLTDGGVLPIAVDPGPAPSPAPGGDAWAQAIAKFPGLDAWLAKNGAHHQETAEEYGAWKLAGDAKLR